MKEIAEETLAIAEAEMEQTVQAEYKNPLIEAITVLPKGELASMAEALVSLTAFKARMSADQRETVGGPIDVAVISKGDGFVWVKRKELFEATRDVIPSWEAGMRGRHP